MYIPTHVHFLKSKCLLQKYSYIYISRCRYLCVLRILQIYKNLFNLYTPRCIARFRVANIFKKFSQFLRALSTHIY